MNREWFGHDYVTGQITAIGNVMRGGNDTDECLPFQMLGGDGEAARQSVNFGLGIAIGVHRVGPLLLNFDNGVGRILEIGKPEPAATVALADLFEGSDSLRIDIVHQSVGDRKSVVWGKSG